MCIYLSVSYYFWWNCFILYLWFGCNSKPQHAKFWIHVECIILLIFPLNAVPVFLMIFVCNYFIISLIYSVISCTDSHVYSYLQPPEGSAASCEHLLTQLCHIQHTWTAHIATSALSSFLSQRKRSWPVNSVWCSGHYVTCLCVFVHSVYCIRDQGGTLQPAPVPNSQYALSTRGGRQLSRQLPAVGRLLHPPVWVSSAGAATQIQTLMLKISSAWVKWGKSDSLSLCLHVSLCLNHCVL